MSLNNRTSQFSLALIAASALAAGAVNAHADVSFHVDLNAADLLTGYSSPFFVAIQLAKNGPDSAVSNTVTATNFTFTGGSFLGTAATQGNALGDFASTITLTPGGTQPALIIGQISTSVTDIGFDVTATGILSDLVHPDEFQIFLGYMSGTGPKQIATTDSDPNRQALAYLDFTSTTLTPSSVQTFTAPGHPASDVTVSNVTDVPEPSTFATLLGGLGMLFGFRRKG